MINEEEIYPLYKFMKKFIEKVEACEARENICYQLLLVDFEKAIVCFDKAGKGYKERYEKEKNNESSM